MPDEITRWRSIEANAIGCASALIVAAVACATVGCGARSALELVLDGSPRAAMDAGDTDDATIDGTDAALDPIDAAVDATEARDACTGSEICNGADDDCDGAIDEGLGFGLLGGPIGVRTDGVAQPRASGLVRTSDGFLALWWSGAPYPEPNFHASALGHDGEERGPSRDVLGRFVGRTLATPTTRDRTLVAFGAPRPGFGFFPEIALLDASGALLGDATPVMTTEAITVEDAVWTGRHHLLTWDSRDGIVIDVRDEEGASIRTDRSGRRGRSPRLSVAGDRTLHVHRVTLADGGRAIVSRVLDAEGRPTTETEIRLDALTDPHEGPLLVAPASDGWLIVWLVRNELGYWTLRVDERGEPIGRPIRRAVPRRYEIEDVALEARPSSGFYLVARHFVTAGPDTREQILAVLDDSGATLDELSRGVIGGGSPGFMREPRIVADGTDAWVLYTDWLSPGGLFVQRYGCLDE